MRLIDADEFIEYLGLDEENAREENLGEIVALEDFDRQPTAYDVDKVVEQLESILESVNIQVELSKDFQPKESESVKSDIVFFTEKKRLCEEFLKIVKSGGID